MALLPMVPDVTDGDWCFTIGYQVLADVRWGIQHWQPTKSCKSWWKWAGNFWD